MNLDRPTDEKHRVWLVDALRGVALLGILWVNIFMRADPIQLIALHEPMDGLRWWVVFTGEWKFRSMFAFLFGFSMAMQARRSANDTTFQNVYQKRLFLLLLFGLFHIVFWWPGDILALYAACGIVLMHFRRSNPNAMLASALALLCVPLLLEFAGLRLFDRALLKADVASAYAIYKSGGFWEITQRRIYDFKSFYVWSLALSFPRVLAMMLFGIWFERKGYLQKYQDCHGFWQRLCVYGYGIGIPANIVYAWWKVEPEPSRAFDLVARFSHDYGAAALCMAYVATVVLCSRIAPVEKALKLLVPMGRMSLTSYLGHSFICAFIFHAYGLALFGELNTLQCVELAISIWLAQVLVSNAWFRRFRMGPLEWLWRWGCHGTRPVFRKHPLPAAAS